MSRAMRTIVSLGTFSALTVGGAASAQQSTAPMPTHAIRGVVKSVSGFYVVITTGSAKKAREMTFELGPSTQTSGNVTIGATVSVRYRVNGHRLLATAVAAPPEKSSVARAPGP